MKHIIALLIMLSVLCGCSPSEGIELVKETSTPVVTATPVPTPEPTPNMPFHIDGVSVEYVITYFNEVCLDAEFVNSGNPSKVQKWSDPIYYRIHGEYTQEDMQVFDSFVAYLNGIEGFPGMYEAGEHYAALNIHFCDYDTLIDLMGGSFYGMDGGVTFWYENDAIYDEIICIRTDLEQSVRNSVILEEIYNGLGPVQDTSLRDDSIIYSGYSTPQQLTEMDRLIIELLYHPEIRCGMSAAECEGVIRRLYS